MAVNRNALDSKIGAKMVQVLVEVGRFTQWSEDGRIILHTIGELASGIDEPSGFGMRVNSAMDAMLEDLSRYQGKEWAKRALLWADTQKEAVSELQRQECRMLKNMGGEMESVFVRGVKKGWISAEQRVTSAKLLSGIAGMYDNGISEEAYRRVEKDRNEMQVERVTVGKLGP